MNLKKKCFIQIKSLSGSQTVGLGPTDEARNHWRFNMDPSFITKNK